MGYIDMDVDGMMEEMRRRMAAREPPPLSQPTVEQMQRILRPCPDQGPGTELKKIFRWFGQKEVEGCKCSDTACTMNLQGPQWCRENLVWIYNRIYMEADSRKIRYLINLAKPLFRMAVETAILLAIRNAELNQTRHPTVPHAG